MALVAALVAAGPGCAGTPEGPRQDTSSAADGTHHDGVTHRFLALRLAGQPVGGVETRVTVGGDGVVSEDRTRLVMRRVNGEAVDRFETETRSTTRYDAQLALIDEISETVEAGVTVRRTVAIQGDGLTATYEGPGRRDAKTFTLPDSFATSMATYQSLRARLDEGETPPLEATYAIFNAQRERFTKKTMILRGRAEGELAPPGPVPPEVGPLYAVTERGEDGDVTRLWADAGYVPVAMELFDGTLVAGWTPDDPFLAADAGAQITSELAVRGVVPRWWDLERLVVRVTVKDDDPTLPALFEDDHYQRVQRDGEVYTLELRDTAPEQGFVAPSRPVAAPEDIRPFLEPTAISQSDARPIQKLARKIAGTQTDSMAAAKSIVRWVYQHLDKRAGARGSATATEVLETRAGDCTEHAALTVALMRAAGIPARNADGIVYLVDADGTAVAGYHAWAEIWIGQWVGVDAVFGETGTSARYLLFGYTEPGMPSSGARLGRTIGRTSIDVIEYQLVGHDPVKL